MPTRGDEGIPVRPLGQRETESWKPWSRGMNGTGEVAVVGSLEAWFAQKCPSEARLVFGPR